MSNFKDQHSEWDYIYIFRNSTSTNKHEIVMYLHKPVENALTSQSPIIIDTSMKLGVEKKYAPNNNIETYNYIQTYRKAL